MDCRHRPTKSFSTLFVSRGSPRGLADALARPGRVHQQGRRDDPRATKKNPNDIAPSAVIPMLTNEIASFTRRPKLRGPLCHLECTGDELGAVRASGGDHVVSIHR